MIAIKHLKRYLHENPGEFPADKTQEILRKAYGKKFAGQAGGQLIMSGGVSELVGTQHAEKLLNLVSTDLEYIKISVQASLDTAAIGNN